jgi:peptide/nickel transport system substrate-binding protein
MLTRRSALGASIATLAAPAVVKAASARVLKFIPQSDLAVIDPIWSTAYNARNHGYMVFDTLFGMDAHPCSPGIVSPPSSAGPRGTASAAC